MKENMKKSGRPAKEALLPVTPILTPRRTGVKEGRHPFKTAQGRRTNAGRNLHFTGKAFDGFEGGGWRERCTHMGKNAAKEINNLPVRRWRKPRKKRRKKKRDGTILPALGGGGCYTDRQGKFALWLSIER